LIIPKSGTQTVDFSMKPVSTIRKGRDIIIIILRGVRLNPLGAAATTGLLYQPHMIDDGDCGTIGGIKIGRGNRNTKRKPAPVPLCPPQIPNDQTRTRIPSRRGGKSATNHLSYGAAQGAGIAHSSPRPPDKLWGPPSFLSNGYCGLFLRE
jgi:hypothetical protein